MVVILHIFGHGGVRDACERFSTNYYLTWFLTGLCYCAVNVFGMLTGYLMVDRKFNVFKIVPLYLTVLFYSAIITILFKFTPPLMWLHKVSYGELIKGICFPVTSRQYWYFTCYFALYFFIPFINRSLCSLNKKEYKILCFSILILFSLLPLLCLGRIDSFSIGGGYTVIWLVCLYIVGGYLKLHPIKIKKTKCVLLYLICIFLAWFSKFASHMVIKYLFKKSTELDLFFSYTSIFIIFAAVALLLLFLQITIKRKLIQRIISFISALSFSVYIIHEHPLVRDYIIQNKFSYLSIDNPILLACKVIVFAFLIFVTCFFIDLIRLLLFKALD